MVYFGGRLHDQHQLPAPWRLVGAGVHDRVYDRPNRQMSGFLVIRRLCWPSHQARLSLQPPSHQPRPVPRCRTSTAITSGWPCALVQSAPALPARPQRPAGDPPDDHNRYGSDQHTCPHCRAVAPQPRNAPPTPSQAREARPEPALGQPGVLHT
jgi:hypothetical protein